MYKAVITHKDPKQTLTTAHSTTTVELLEERTDSVKLMGQIADKGWCMPDGEYILPFWITSMKLVEDE